MSSSMSSKPVLVFAAGFGAGALRADAGTVPLLELNPVLTGLRTYPFVRLAEARQRLVPPVAAWRASPE